MAQRTVMAVLLAMVVVLQSPKAGGGPPSPRAAPAPMPAVAPHTGVPATGDVPAPAAGEVLVRWSARGDSIARSSAAGAVGGTVHEIGLEAIGVSLVRFDPDAYAARLRALKSVTGSRSDIDLDRASALAAAEIARQSGVAWAEPNARYALVEGPATANDPAFNQQPGLRRHGFPTAWGISHGDGVRVAVLDSGIDCRHPDLAGMCDRGFDYLRDSPTSGVDNGDPHGHGTHVASIACANTDNAIGMAGAGWGCHVADHKVADAQGYIDTAAAARALVTLVDDPDYRADVANMSFGGPAASKSLAAAIVYAEAGGVVLVAAAGNDGTSRAHYPCALPQVLCVGAVDANTQRAWFSNTGHHAVVATGVSVLGAGTGTTRTVQMSGTSQASPHAAAAVALATGMLAKRGERWSPARIRQLVIGTAEDLGAVGSDALYGHGVVRADLALKRLVQTAGDTTPAVPPIDARGE